ncbi:hypothetical protein [Brevundimonas diminuta]|uniref:hypothetical protein n=1 Tax=Brevundimonas diminuta TaxID=293 RepID=UPI00320B3C90
MSLRLLLFAVFTLSGCASPYRLDLPTCDGTARRPANPHGSVLSPAPTAAAQAATPTKAAPAQTGGSA